jgi:hypothetical protein
MKVKATDFKQNFGHYAEMIRSGIENEIQVTRRGSVVGVYSKPKRSEMVPFIGITTKDLTFSRDELHER